MKKDKVKTKIRWVVFRNHKKETDWVGIVPAFTEKEAIEIYKRHTISRIRKAEYSAKPLKVTKK